MSRNKVGFLFLGLLLAICSVSRTTKAGLIKDLVQKITHTNNRTEKAVRESAPICGSGVFSTPDEASLSPELIFISTRPSRVRQVRQVNNQRGRNNQSGSSDGQTRGARRGGSRVEEISKEFSFHVENVTIEELERYGFNPDAPVSFLIHGFTSGYPLQAWISAIVEAYTIDRETNNSGHSSSSAGSSEQNHGSNQNQHFDREPARETYENVNENYSPNYQRSNKQNQRDTNYSSSNQRERRATSSQYEDSASSFHKRNPNSNSQNSYSSADKADHNLFIVNWNYAARGILYPRAVANIPIVASYVTRFINDKLIDEAQVDPNRIQLIGHSLGAHLAGFIGKNTKSKLARIYGLDPAGPCFGTISGPLYPSSKRLAPTDAREVITVQTNSALLGIEKPLGKYSVFVEGGANQPGCKPSGVLKSIGTLTWDGGDFDTVACSHSRAPNLLTYRHEQSNSESNCQMVAYACKDWQSFLEGHCGVCADGARAQGQRGKQSSPLDPVDCHRIGLDWQYPTSTNSNRRPKSNPSHRPNSHNSFENTSNNQEHYENHNSGPQQQHYGGQSSSHYSSTRRPSFASAGYGNENHSYESSGSNGHRKPSQSSDGSYLSDRHRRDTENLSEQFVNSSLDVEERRSRDNEVEPISMFLRTGDTQPYCAFHYQIVLELNEPFGRRKPPMSILLQDSEPDARRGSEQNSLSSDEFGNKFNDKMYTHLLTSNRKLARIDHAVMIFREGLQEGHQKLKMIHVNYMSNADSRVRERLSSRLCPVRSEEDRSQPREQGNNRFYFKPCGQNHGQPPSPHNSSNGSNNHHNESFNSHSSQNNDDNSQSNHQFSYNGNSNSNSNQNEREQYARNKTNYNN